MKKISDFKNEDAVDLLAGIFEPVTSIFGDPEIIKASEENIPQVKLVSLVLKRHKKEIVEILATMDGVPVEEYSCTPVTILTKILSLTNDKELVAFFASQSQTAFQTPSGSVMENTEASET